MKAFIALVEHGAHADIASDKASIESHLLAFAAEQARIEHRTVDFTAYVESLKG